MLTRLKVIEYGDYPLMLLLDTLWTIMLIYLAIGGVLGAIVTISMIYDALRGREGMGFVPAVMFVIVVIIGWPLVIVVGG